MRIGICLSVLFISIHLPALAQDSASTAARPYFILGADVSYLRSLESKGLEYRDEGQVHPGLEILRHHGYNWVRLRIMNEPTRLPNTLAYTLAEAKSAKAMGFRILLDFHYSDDWADPSHEKTPAAWAKLPHDQLVDAVFKFTRDTVTAFRNQGTMPDMVQIGNEITSGMLWPDGKLPDRWPQLAELLSAGVEGAEAGKGDRPRPAIMIHIDQGGNEETTKWFFDNLVSRGVQFDVIGQSYYPWWQGTLQQLKETLAFTANRYKKPIILVETAYDWRDGEEFKKRQAPVSGDAEGTGRLLCSDCKGGRRDSRRAG